MPLTFWILVHQAKPLQAASPCVFAVVLPEILLGKTGVVGLVVTVNPPRLADYGWKPGGKARRPPVLASIREIMNRVTKTVLDVDNSVIPAATGHGNPAMLDYAPTKINQVVV